MEAAEAAIENSNIPRGDAKAISFSINFLNGCYVHPEKYLRKVEIRAEVEIK